MKSKFFKRFALIPLKNKVVFKVCLGLALFFEELSKSLKKNSLVLLIGNCQSNKFLMSLKVAIAIRQIVNPVYRWEQYSTGTKQQNAFDFIPFAKLINV